MYKGHILALIAEDNDDIRAIYKKKFINEGFNVIEAFNGRDALEKMAQDPSPDVIVLDLLMPGSDGFEFLRKKERYEDHAKIPVVVLSNLGQNSDIEQALDYDVCKYLVKSHYTPKEVLEKVKDCVKDKNKE